MDAVEVPLLEKAKGLFRLFFPGLIERLEAINGEWAPVPLAPRTTKPNAHGVRNYQMSVAYHAHARDARIDLRVTVEVTADSQRMVAHSYHLGPRLATDDYFVRICENLSEPYHFHLRNWSRVYQGGHIPANKADPPLSRNPLDFLTLVENFLKTNQIAIQVKK